MFTISTSVRGEMMRLFIAELRKLLISNRALIFIVTAVILQIILSFVPKTYEHSYSPEVYRKYTELLAGEVTPEKVKFLQEKCDEYTAAISGYPEKYAEYLDGSITIEEFSLFTEQNVIASAELSTVEYLLNKAGSFNGRFKAEFFYDTDFENFFAENGFDFLLLPAVLCIVVPVFGIEYSGNSTQMILVSKNGRVRLAVLKILASCVIVYLLSWVMSALRLGFFVSLHGTENFGKSAGNLLNCGGVNNVSILQYYLVDSLVKAVCWTVLAVFICMVTTICRNTGFSFILSFLTISAPLLLNGLGGNELLGYFFDTVVLSGMYRASFSFWVFAVAAVVKAAAFGVISARCWIRSERQAKE